MGESTDVLLPINSALGPVWYTGVSIGNGPDRFRVTVRPLPIRGADETYFLISVEADARKEEVATVGDDMDVPAASSRRLTELEEELRYTKENLQATVEEMETTNEE